MSFKVDFKVDIKRDYRGDIREYLEEFIFLPFKGSRQVKWMVLWFRNGQGWFQLKFKGST